jgi:hypothetical protein
VTNPSAAQAALANVSAVVDVNGVVQSTSSTGSYPAIVDFIYLQLSVMLSPKVHFSSLKYSTGIDEPYPHISSMAPLTLSVDGASGSANITTVGSQLTLVLDMVSNSKFFSHTMIEITIGLAPGIPASGLLLCNSCSPVLLIDGREHIDHGIYVDPMQ